MTSGRLLTSRKSEFRIQNSSRTHEWHRSEFRLLSSGCLFWILTSGFWIPSSVKNRRQIRPALPLIGAAVHLNGVFDVNRIQRFGQMPATHPGEPEHRERDEEHSEKVDISSQHYATPTLSSTIRPSNSRMVRSA